MEGKDIDRIIEMAWEDRTPFEAIKIHLMVFHRSDSSAIFRVITF